jgi:hypothetical protein
MGAEAKAKAQQQRKKKEVSPRQRRRLQKLAKLAPAGGAARHKALSAEKRSEIARKAAKAKWAKFYQREKRRLARRDYHRRWREANAAKQV